MILSVDRCKLKQITETVLALDTEWWALNSTSAFKERGVRTFNKEFHEKVSVLIKGNRVEEMVKKRTESKTEEYQTNTAI